MKILKISENFSFSSANARKKLPRVGFFDSGIGGLTVLYDAICAGIEAEFYYYGDNARAPYGNLPPSVIADYTRQAFDEFQRIPVDVAVVACNTVTALCVDDLRKKYSFPIVGTEPAVLPAVRAFREVAVLVTEATLKSERFNRLCAYARERYPDRTLSPVACPLLAGAIERGVVGGEAVDYAEYLPALTACRERAAVVLGCTHYSFLRRYISEAYRLPVIDGNGGVVRQLKKLLAERSAPDAKDLKSLDVSACDPTTTDRPPTTTAVRSGDKTDASRTEERGSSKKIRPFSVVFLGSGHENNKKVYEHMFGNGFCGH